LVENKAAGKAPVHACGHEEASGAFWGLAGCVAGAQEGDLLGDGHRTIP
jgi:hypothetical protein